MNKLKRRKSSKPAIAERRQREFEEAVTCELRRRLQSGEKISISSVTVAAKYPNGRSVNRTTIYDRRPDGSRVHESLIQEINSANQQQAELKKRRSRNRTAKELWRDTRRLRDLTTCLANELTEARSSAAEAVQVALSKEREIRGLKRELYKIIVAFAVFSGSRNWNLRERIANLGEEIGPEDEKESRREGERLANLISEGIGGAKPGRAP